MAKYNYIYIDVYKRSIYVFIGNHEEFKKWVNSYFKDIPTFDDFIQIVNSSPGTAQATCYFNNIDGISIIEIPTEPVNPTDIGYVVHEALHATFNICQFCNIEYTSDGSNEEITYLHELIVSIIFHFDKYNLIENKL